MLQSRRLLTACAVTCIWVCGVTNLHAQSDRAQFDALVESGEFGPAVQLAGQQGDGARDQWMAEVARAQARIGSRRASAWSLSQIGSDSLANETLDRMAGETFGGAGARGGAALADFDTLIELITSTIAPDSWDEVGGPGAIEAFPTGVYVDTEGLMQKVKRRQGNANLVDIRESSRASSGNRNVRRRSDLRKVSLNRLERQLRMRRHFGMEAGEDMKYLAGIYRIDYVLFYPDTNDVVIAGPADDWRLSDEGRVVGVTDGQPVLHLDDLVVLLRNAANEHGRFGCAITPRKENLAKVQTFLAKSAGKKLPAGRAAKQDWLEDLQTTLGRQDITVHGVNPGSRVARTIVEADYHMKLVGIGLQEGTIGVESYLDSLDPKQPPSTMNVLRWWFTLKDTGLKTTPDQLAFDLRGESVKVLSENEMLTETGQRIHTGKSNELNSRFANSFTNQFANLCQKYPVYADLRNVFDLAIVAALCRQPSVTEKIDWSASYFMDPEACRVAMGNAPTEVQSVINHRDLRKQQFVVGVSGGVLVDTQSLISTDSPRKVDDYGIIQATRSNSTRRELSHDTWWWD